MAVYLQTALHMAQASLSSYSLYHAYISITNLQKYESKSEKAAKYSDTAANELYKTRTTQTSATLAILASLLTSLTLIFSPSTPLTISKPLFNAVNVAICLAARQHVSGFWEGKAKVPFVQGYNSGINSTLINRDNLTYLAGIWAVTAVLEGWRFWRA